MPSLLLTKYHGLIHKYIRRFIAEVVKLPTCHFSHLLELKRFRESLENKGDCTDSHALKIPLLGSLGGAGKHPTLDFSAGNDLRVVRLSPWLGSTLGGEPAQQSASLSLFPSNSSISLFKKILYLSLSIYRDLYIESLYVNYKQWDYGKFKYFSYADLYIR